MGNYVQKFYCGTCKILKRKKELIITGPLSLTCKSCMDKKADEKIDKMLDELDDENLFVGIHKVGPIDDEDLEYTNREYFNKKEAK